MIQQQWGRCSYKTQKRKDYYNPSSLKLLNIYLLSWLEHALIALPPTSGAQTGMLTPRNESKNKHLQVIRGYNKKQTKSPLNAWRNIPFRCYHFESRITNTHISCRYVKMTGARTNISCPNKTQYDQRRL